ncbi:MAG: GNAT family N-acetyltransferase [Candidatus Glassbacteria bacterium]
MSKDSTELTVGWFDRSMINDYANLFSETFGVSVESRYFIWKYMDHPLSFSAVSVAYLDSQLIGALGAIPKKMKVNDMTLVGTHELDMMVKKEYRNLGVFFKLFKFRLSNRPERKVSMSFGLNDSVLRAFAQRFLGYRDVDTIPEFVRVLDTSHYLRQRFGDRILGKLLEIPLLFIFLMIDFLSHLTALVPSLRYRIAAVDRFENGFDELWNRVSMQMGIAVVRDSAYLNWRYVENPQCNYEIYVAKDSRGGVAGFIIFTLLPAPHEHGVILEFIVDPKKWWVGFILLRKTLSRMKACSAKTAVSWSFPHQWTSWLLKATGFHRRGQNLFLQVRRISEGLEWEYLTDSSKWFISIGDNDFYYGCPV